MKRLAFTALLSLVACDAPTTTPLELHSVTPTQGTARGGQRIKVTGAGFDDSTTATLGGHAARVVDVTDTTLTVVTPSGVAGPAMLEVTVGEQKTKLADAYTYALPDWASVAGGGAAAVIDVNTGAILAMVSYPLVDPMLFNPSSLDEGRGHRDEGVTRLADAREPHGRGAQPVFARFLVLFHETVFFQLHQETPRRRLVERGKARDVGEPDIPVKLGDEVEEGEGLADGAHVSLPDLVDGPCRAGSPHGFFAASSLSQEAPFCRDT